MSDNIHIKLSKIQSKLKAPKSQRNTFGNYNYRNCEDIMEAAKPLLNEQGLSLVVGDDIVMVANRIYVKAIATLSDGTNTIQTSALAREAEFQKGMSDSQLTGSASSYARKYALNGLFAIDDTKDSDHDSQYQAEPQQRPETLSGYLKAKDINAKDFVSYFMIQAAQAKELLNNKTQIDNMIVEFNNRGK